MLFQRSSKLTIAAIALAMVLIPTAAFAAVGTFTSTTATPAVTATNSSTVANAKGVQGNATGTNTNARWGVTGLAGGANGIGVQGTGTKYGVFSNGPLGVAAGKPLSCTGCVSPTNLSSAAKAIQPLASGQSESGMYGVGGDNSTAGLIMVALNYSRPLATAIAPANIVDTGAGANANCPGPGSAAAGYLCLYPNNYFNVTFFSSLGSTTFGASIAWTQTAAGPLTNGQYTVTAA
jgi:hypothetical protein